MCQKGTKSHLPVPSTAEEKALGGLRAPGPSSTFVNFLFAQYVKLQQYFSRLIMPTCVVPVPIYVCLPHWAAHLPLFASEPLLSAR